MSCKALLMFLLLSLLLWILSLLLILLLCGAGYLSWRSHVWTDVDNNRCGTLPFVFDDDFGFDRYVEYALDVPMYFVYRCETVYQEYSHCCVDCPLVPHCSQAWSAACVCFPFLDLLGHCRVMNGHCTWWIVRWLGYMRTLAWQLASAW